MESKGRVRKIGQGAGRGTTANVARQSQVDAGAGVAETVAEGGRGGEAGALVEGMGFFQCKVEAFEVGRGRTRQN